MKIKTLLKYVVEFIMSITLFLFISFLILKTTVFNEHYFISQLDKNNYFESLYETVNKNMSYYIVQSGLTKDVLTDIYTVNDLKKNVKDSIGVLYGKAKTEIDTTAIKKRLEDNIKRYLESNSNLVADDNSLDMFVSKMMDVYVENIELSNTIDTLAPKFTKLNAVINTILIISFILVALSFAYLTVVSKRGRLSVSIMTCGILLIVIYFFFNKNVDVKNIVFYNDAVSNIIRAIFSNILKLFKYTGIVVLVFGFIFTLKRQIRQNRLKIVKIR